MVLVQVLLNRVQLKERLPACFAHLGVAPIFGHDLIALLLVVHLLLGYREFRDARYYRDDPSLRKGGSHREGPGEQRGGEAGGPRFR